MNYEKKYKEALEKAKTMIDDLRKGEDILAVSELESMFPELKESEDEKIRNWLIGYFHQYKEDGMEKYANGLKVEAIIDWLEKQGEKKPYWQREKCSDCQFNYAGECKGFCQMKRNEQKTTDKVKPKFHEGEWITNGDYTWKIVEVMPLDYILQSQDGNMVDDTISHVDEQFHSFTIKDAKDGDVLADSCQGFNNPFICILKRFENVDFGLTKLSDFSSYCYLTMSDNQKFKKGHYHHMHNIHPATKEQRDLLFQKMHEAGYMWNSESKQLLSLKAEPSDEQKPADLEEFINELSKQFPDVSFAKLSRIAVRVAKWAKFVWNEEDNKWIESLIQSFEDGYLEGFNQLKSYGIIDWLKSLKDGVQPKQKWSEEDENMLTDTEYLMRVVKLENRSDNEYQRAENCINWLKSLRPQPKQKWSEEDECNMNECINAIATKDGWSFEEKRKIKHWLKLLKERL